MLTMIRNFLGLNVERDLEIERNILEKNTKKFMKLLRRRKVLSAEDIGFLIGLIEDRGLPERALHKAAIWGHTEIVRILLAAGAAVNAQSNDLRTPLHYVVTDAFWCDATSRDCIDIIQKLITAGANIDAQDIQGKTALHYAIEHSNIETIQKLLANGARIDIKSNDVEGREGQTPLALASNKKPRFFKSFLEILINTIKDDGFIYDFNQRYSVRHNDVNQMIQWIVDIDVNTEPGQSLRNQIIEWFETRYSPYRRVINPGLFYNAPGYNLMSLLLSAIPEEKTAIAVVSSLSGAASSSTHSQEERMVRCAGA